MADDHLPAQDTETLDGEHLDGGPLDGATAAGSWVREPTSLERGSSLGRYIVLHKLGEGGMGQVYAAYDPELDRRVAVKIRRFSSDNPESFSSRLRQEGRALARLQHPNVVTVFDVGVSDRRLFIATELVQGLTVDRWLEAEKRSWREVVDVFIEVGSGIAAAHAEGLVHRDIKPSNMMVSDQGRAQVLDFGIARDADLSEGSTIDLDALSRADLPRGSVSQTQTGAVVGTPAFMAPEQRAGNKVGPAADIYSFCLCLHLALFRELPEERSSEQSTPSSATDGAAAGAPAAGAPAAGEPAAGEPAAGEPAAGEPAAGAPAGLRRLVLSGLRKDPEKRPSSMAELIQDLRRFRNRGRRVRRWMTGATIVILATTLWWTWHRSQATPCATISQRWHDVWNEGRADALSERFQRVDRPFAADVWKTVLAGLDRFGVQWTDNARQWCLAATDGSLSPELFDLRTDCLDLRLRAVDATVSLLEKDTDRLVSQAVTMIDELPAISECFDIRALRAPTPPPTSPRLEEQLPILLQSQADAHALWAAGDFDAAAETTSGLVAGAKAIEHWPLAAEALHQQALIEDARLDKGSADTLVEATLAAAAGNHNRVIAESFVRLVKVAGLHLQDFERADRYAEQAASALRALGSPGDLQARLHHQMGINLRHRGRYSEALDSLRQSLNWRTENLGDDHHSVAETLLSLGNVYDDLNDHSAAREILDRALSIQIQRFGPSHPIVAETYARLGTLAREARNLEDATRFHRKAMDIHRRVHGDNSATFAQSLTYLGELQALDGHFDEAEQSFAQALGILEQSFGPDHANLAVAYATMASAWTEAGRDEQALEPYAHALQIFERAFGAEHPQVGVLRFNLATVHLRLRNLEEAARDFERAAGIWRRALGENHPLVANALTGLGDAWVRLGRFRDALPMLREADRFDAEADAEQARDPKDQADTAFALARALDLAGTEPDRVKALVERAQKLYGTVPEASRRELDELSRWLDRRANRRPR